MRGKEYIKTVISSFFIVVTLVNFATFLLGSIYRPDDRFGYEAFLSPLIYGIFSSLPVIVMYSRRELTLKELLIRKGIQLIMIEALLMMVSFGFGGFVQQDPFMLIVFGLSILVIYVLVHFIMWALQSKDAKEMTEDLQQYQQSVDKENE